VQGSFIKEPALSKLIEKTEKELRLLESIYDKTNEDLLYKNHMQKVVELVESIENLSLRLRRDAVKHYDYLLCVHRSNFENISSEKYFEREQKPIFKENINVHLNGNCVVITMPPLLKNISAKSKHYIYHCVYEAIREYKKHTELKKYHEHAIAIICNKRPHWDRLYDADNVEINGIINALTPHFFQDDSSKYLSIYRMGMEDKNASTSIYLMPLSDFPSWLMEHQININK